MEKSIYLEPYPIRNGIAIPAIELELPETELGQIFQYESSNHHDCWSKRKFGRYILYSTLRDLEICQTVLPDDVHKYIHDTYEPPDLPRPYEAYQFILEAAVNGVKLKTGSANKPEYEPISDKLLERVHINYKRLKTQ
ncbi:MAG: hypothetical protein WCK26_01095 [Candidatus Saccharibacteria bacterium]